MLVLKSDNKFKQVEKAPSPKRRVANRVVAIPQPHANALKTLCAGGVSCCPLAGLCTDVPPQSLLSSCIVCKNRHIFYCHQLLLRCPVWLKRRQECTTWGEVRGRLRHKLNEVCDGLMRMMMRMMLMLMMMNDDDDDADDDDADDDDNADDADDADDDDGGGDVGHMCSERLLYRCPNNNTNMACLLPK